MTPVHHQNPATWECKDHVVFIPKYRKKAIFGVTKKRLGDVFHELARRPREQDRGRASDARPCPHAHFRSAEIFRGGGDRLYQGGRVRSGSRRMSSAKRAISHKFWARGYFVSTAGRDEETLRASIKSQELQDRELDQLALTP